MILEIASWLRASTIFEWAGGRDVFESWLGRFYDLVEDDELLGRWIAR